MSSAPSPFVWAMTKTRGVVRRVRSVPKRVRHKYRAAQLRWTAIRKLAKREREWRVPLRQRRPRWLMRGYLSRSAVLYDLDRRGSANYISDLQRVFRLKRMVNPLLQDVINNKLTTHLLLGALGVRSAKLIGVYWRQLVHAFPSEGRQPIADYLHSLDTDRPVFFKVLAGAEGKDLVKLQRYDAHHWMVNGQLFDHEAACRVFQGQKHPMVIEEGLEQHPKVSELYPHAVNTIRVLTMLNVADGEPFVVMAVQRIGTEQSQHVDNWSRGGLSARIDVDAGQLGPAARLPSGDTVDWFDAHPDTGALINGRDVPHWPEIHDMVLRAARIMSFLEYIGWDIVVTEDGPMVLEANINTGMNVLQVHQPLLVDPRVRAYYAERGVTPAVAVDPPKLVTDTDPV